MKQMDLQPPNPPGNQFLTILVVVDSRVVVPQPRSPYTLMSSAWLQMNLKSGPLWWLQGTYVESDAWGIRSYAILGSCTPYRALKVNTNTMNWAQDEMNRQLNHHVSNFLHLSHGWFLKKESTPSSLALRTKLVLLSWIYLVSCAAEANVLLSSTSWCIVLSRHKGLLCCFMTQVSEVKYSAMKVMKDLPKGKL